MHGEVEIGREGWRDTRLPMAEQYKDHQRERGKDDRNRQEALKDRE